MGVIVTPQVEIDKYFDSDALSQSQLKKLILGIDAFVNNKKEEKELFYEEKGHFIIGSAVDTLLTGEEGEFEKQYYVSNLEKKPSDVEMSIIRMVFDEVKHVKVDELDKYPGSISNAIEFHNWQANWKIETKIAKIITIGNEYFEDLKAGLGKQILTSTENKLIQDIVFSLKSNRRTSLFFDRKSYEKSDNITIYYQLPIYFYYKNVYCKALLDILVIMKDNNGNIISVQPIDLKTMNGSTLRFLNNLKSFRYDIQAAWYTEALKAIDSSFIHNLSILEEGVIKPFLFIVESNSYPGQPLIYQIDEEIMKIGKFGKKDLLIKTPNYEYPEVIKHGHKGFDELIEMYIYQEFNDWKEEKIITDNPGVFKLGWNGIK